MSPAPVAHAKDGSFRREVVNFLVTSGALRFGNFKLKSGEFSPFFFNLGDLATGRDLDRLADLYAEGLRTAFPDASLLYGPPYKGIVLAGITSVACFRRWNWDIPICYNRKESKDHGEGGLLVGHPPVAEDRVVIIDDVFSSGATKLAAAEMFSEHLNVCPSGILVAMDRRKKGVAVDPALPPVRTLADLDDVTEFLEDTDPARARIVRQFAEEGVS
jgi:orotate phosphoribosyltransferase